mmetsp:Transcript_16337/g.24624  ORF Transcript_16337/g.24624 Transcript_16337/m.24624 type:complete len:420 (+) Transcript_16337:49-1308(+)
MRHVELTELTKLVQDEEELSSSREARYTCAKFRGDVEEWIRPDLWTKEQWTVALYVTLLLVSSTGERLIFKMAVDSMAPFRAVLLLLILFTSMIIHAAIAIGKRVIYKDSVVSNVFPHKKLFFMGLFDSISFSGLVISATGVSPTMTVILMHANTPLIVLGSRYIFPDRQYSATQKIGVAWIFVALLIGVSRPLLDVFGLLPRSGLSSPSATFSSAVSSLVYVCSAAMQGLGALYKEKCIIDFAQPADVHIMSCWLFFYQLLFALLGFPILYVLQGISSDWVGYPITSFSENFWDGLYCWLGQDPDPESSSYDTAHTSCRVLFWLIISYVISTVIVLQCIDKVLATNNRVLGRSMAAAVLTSFLGAWIYANTFSSNIQNPTIGVADFVSILVLLTGMEVFGRDPDPDPELVTSFSPSRA